MSGVFDNSVTITVAVAVAVAGGVAGGGGDEGMGAVGEVEHAIISFKTNNEGFLIVGTHSKN